MTRDIMPPASCRRSRVAASAVAFVLALPAVLGFAVAASAAPPSVNCNGVFNGVTPADPIDLSSPATVVLGGTVAHSITWVSGGTVDIDLVDCFLVDFDPLTGTSAGTLDPIVEPMNTNYEGPNDGNEVLMISVPNDAALIGHVIWARVKCSKGCHESRSAAVPFGLVVPDPGPSPSPSPSDTPSPSPSPSTSPTVDPSPSESPSEEPSSEPTPSESPTTEPSPEPTPTTDPTDVGGDQETNDPDDPSNSTVLGTRQVRKASPAVLPKKLAKTGPETTLIAWIGSILLALGIALRFVRVSPLRQAFTGFGASATNTTRSAFTGSTVADFVLFNGAILASRGRLNRRRWIRRR